MSLPGTDGESLRCNRGEVGRDIARLSTRPFRYRSRHPDIVAPVCQIKPTAANASAEGVPVLSRPARQWRPGGAGLAAMLAATDGWSVTVVAAFGDDEPGQRIRADLAAAGVSVIELPSQGPTPVKLRMRARGQTLLMVDDCAPVTAVGDPPTDVARVLTAADGVLVADYGRGVAAQPQLRALLTAVSGRVPVVWDPHRHGPAPIPRVSVVVPNQDEATCLADDDIVGSDLDADLRRARNLRARWRCDHAVVTRGADGAVLVGGAGLPTRSR